MPDISKCFTLNWWVIYCELPNDRANNIQELNQKKKLHGEEHWNTFQAEETFEVPANTEFKVNVKEPVDYCCSYS